LTSAWNSSVENAIHAWVVAGSGLPADKVIWSLQTGPLLELPYITMRCAVVSTSGLDWIDLEFAANPTPENEVDYIVRGSRRALLELQCYADATDVTGMAAQSILGNVIASARLPSIRSALNTAKIGVSVAEPIQFLGQVADSVGFEPRAITRIPMHLVNEISETGTFIETVQIVPINE